MFNIAQPRGRPAKRSQHSPASSTSRKDAPQRRIDRHIADSEARDDEPHRTSVVVPPPSSFVYVPQPFFGSVARCEAAAPAEDAQQLEATPTLLEQADEAVLSKAETVTTPPLFTDQYNRVKGLVQADTWDGVRVDIQRALTPTFFSAYSGLLGSSAVQGGNALTFTSTVVSEDQTRVLMGRMSKDGDLDGRVFCPIGNILGKVQFTLGAQDTIQATAEMKDSSSACQVTAGLGTFGFSFNQALTARLTAGMDCTYHAQMGDAPISVGGQYQTRDWTGNVLYGPGMMQLQYARHVNERVQLGAELALNPLRPQESAVAVGAEFNLKQSKLHFAVNGSGTVDGNIEVRFLPMASVSFAGQLNHVEDKHRFGFGMQMHVQG
ncbi:eukaryotic porin-domain-containing protein [Tribonema minus]|uniref:Eukaryotic porin-domain-containing protein n=1 Tax=Tribonema minus TaxID=303371 RepID=A0A836CIJ7_9STRA|nr:eukaryotic porin-domain-containing protein [Tribonema minus]